MSSLRMRKAIHESAHVIAAIALRIPIRDVTIEGRPRPAAGVELLVRSAAETRYCGPISDDGDLGDVMQARRYLSCWFDAAAVEYELAHWRDEADRMVRQRWARREDGRVPSGSSTV